MADPVGPISITVKPTGPYTIEGPVVIRDVDGNLLQPPPNKRPGTVKLCGCGRSRIRPFCDGTHNDP